MHCWTPTSDLYIGCEEGHLLMVNGENLKVTVLNKIEDGPPRGKELLCFIFPETVAIGDGFALDNGCFIPYFSLSRDIFDSSFFLIL